MSKAVSAIFIFALLAGTVYLFAHRHPRRHARHAVSDDSTSTAEAESDSSAQKADFASHGSAQAQPVLAKGVTPPAVRRQNSITDDKKVHLDIAKLLLKDAAFRAANPQLTLDKFMSGEADLNSIKLPKGLKLSYEFDPACREAQNTVASTHELSLREKKNLSDGAPAYLTREVTDEATTVGSLSAQTSTDNCIRGMTFDAGSKVGDKIAGNLTASVQAQAEQKQAADQAIRDAVQNDGQAKMAIVGLKADLKAADPSLMIKAPDGRYVPTPADYQVGAGTDSPGDAVDLQRRPFVVHPSPSGSYTDSDVSNAIIHAADRGYKVINVTVPGFESGTYQSAIDYAKEHGATVVVQVPIPPPSKTVLPQPTTGAPAHRLPTSNK